MKAHCPECRAEMAQTDVVCPQCGYDFPLAEPVSVQPSGMAYSSLADFSLVVGEVAAILGAALAILYAIILLLSFHLFYAFIAAVGFFLSLANFVVFVRVRDMTKDRSRSS